MESFQTEFKFELPIGYVDEEGTLHKEGIMRRATAGDEILPIRDPRVQQNPSYLTVILLSRVIRKLGSLQAVSTGIVENLYATDFAYLQDKYNQINQTGTNKKVSCPKCNENFEVEIDFQGE